ncbi:MAG: hypothetical protein ISP90_16765 [Nevskia sp.]|nr:hypothetical protein [Nevskia sp.]
MNSRSRPSDQPLEVTWGLRLLTLAFLIGLVLLLQEANAMRFEGGAAGWLGLARRHWMLPVNAACLVALYRRHGWAIWWYVAKLALGVVSLALLGWQAGTLAFLGISDVAFGFMRAGILATAAAVVLLLRPRSKQWFRPRSAGEMRWRNWALVSIAMLVGGLVVEQSVIESILDTQCHDEVLAQLESPDGKLAAEDIRSMCYSQPHVERTLEIGPAQPRAGDSSSQYVFARAGAQDAFGDVAAPPLQFAWLSDRRLRVTFPRGTRSEPPDSLKGVSIEAGAQP